MRKRLQNRIPCCFNLLAFVCVNIIQIIHELFMLDSMDYFILILDIAVFIKSELDLLWLNLVNLVKLLLK